MKLGYTIVYVKNLVETVAFYQKAFSLEIRCIIEDQYAEMETGACALAFASDVFMRENGIMCRPNTIEQSAVGFEIAFTVDDVQLVFDTAIQNGATIVVRPIKKPWGQIVSYVKDCNGVLVEICSSVQHELV